MSDNPTDDRSERSSSEAQDSKRTLAIGAVVSLCLIVMAAAFYLSSRGSASASDGIPAIARVERSPEGACAIGVKHSHCYRLFLTVYPQNSSSFQAQLDVNVEDRFASRVQPGSYVYVVQDKSTPSSVYLNTDALSEPAPKQPASSQSGS
jgi:hypothetical protein